MKSYERRIKVEEAIKRELANIVQAGMIKDDRLSTFVSIVDVELNKALSTAQVSFSLLGVDELPDEGTVVGIKAALEENSGRVAGMVARKLNLRYAPTLHFNYRSLSEGADLVHLIDKVNSSSVDVDPAS